MRHGKARFIIGFLALPVLLYAYYVLWPFAQAAAYSLTNWGGYSDTQDFVGFQNYARLLKDELVRKAFWHNVFFLVTVPLFTIVVALFLAFLLNVGGRGNRAGIRGVWGSSLYMVLFSAAMQSIPKDFYEAALLDGASRVHTFFRVTLPLLRDTVSVAWVYLGFIALDMYALVYVMTPDQGGPSHTSEIFASVINFTAFNRGQFGYACAIGVALAIFTILLAAFQLRITRRERIEF